MTKSTSQPNSFLFDKGVIRRVYERRVRLALGESPTLLQVEAANAYARVAALTNRLYITEQTSNILIRRTPTFAASILTDTRPLKKGRYLRRWARRLREFTFSPEDAIVLAYGSFGIDEGHESVGVDTIITADTKLAAHYAARYTEIEGRFEEMVVNLPERYPELTLPLVVTTATILAKF